ncbi:hypothetical protein WQE_47419 [Paraburkholderia hospita]|uniref:DUF3564 domain-containing protein n=1 Tax=Paraburkholderia hospita TaxID=169430 RepID=A0ABP2P876_9BURK|nr:hypothetical protein WQE_47419 [Paraburkholderia hospita]
MNIMRITVHLSTFDRDNPCAYAILWLDVEPNKWFREGYFGFDLPEWGTWTTDHGDTLIRAPHSTRPLCLLDELDMSGHGGSNEGKTGAVYWCGNEGLLRVQGHWHVQCDDQGTAVHDTACSQTTALPNRRRSSNPQTRETDGAET